MTTQLQNTTPNNKIDDGGPAFPIFRHLVDGLGGQSTEILSHGISIRDYFAGQALAGLLARSDIDGPDTRLGSVNVAHSAYAIADAMIAARKGGA